MPQPRGGRQRLGSADCSGDPGMRGPSMRGGYADRHSACVAPPAHVWFRPAPAPRLPVVTRPSDRPLEGFIHRQAPDAVEPKEFATTIKVRAAGLRIFLPNSLQRPEIGRAQPGQAFDLERMEPRFPRDNEVDLGPGSPGPEVYRGIDGRIVRPGARVLHPQAFRGPAVNFVRPVQVTLRPKRPEDARVEEAQLVSRHGGTHGTLPEDRNPVRNEKVVEDPHVARNHRALHPTLPRRHRDVELSGVREGDRFRNVADAPILRARASTQTSCSMYRAA